MTARHVLGGEPESRDDVKHDDEDSAPPPLSTAESALLRTYFVNGLSLAPAGANVIMQLSRLEVGHGIADSTVTSGSLHRHPIKRTRTTLGYIMIALFGTPDERRALRHEVNRQHGHVRSSRDDDVPYDAFDPELQLWVAACMYRGVSDSIEVLFGHLDDSIMDAIYSRSSRFATTLQVPPSMWPVDRVAFTAYWSEAERKVLMDDKTRAYLYDLASLRFLPAPFSRLFGPAHRFITAGFLPPRFRHELGLGWSERDERNFRRFTSALRFINERLPRPMREFPWNLVLRDARRRLANGRPFV